MGKIRDEWVEACQKGKCSFVYYTAQRKLLGASPTGHRFFLKIANIFWTRIPKNIKVKNRWLPFDKVDRISPAGWSYELPQAEAEWDAQGWIMEAILGGPDHSWDDAWRTEDVRLLASCPEPYLAALADALQEAGMPEGHPALERLRGPLPYYEGDWAVRKSRGEA